MRAGERLRYEFVDVPVYGRCVVVYPPHIPAPSRHECWWRHVAGQYVERDATASGFNAMRRLWPNRARNPVTSETAFKHFIFPAPLGPRAVVHVHFERVGANAALKLDARARKAQAKKTARATRDRIAQQQQAALDHGAAAVAIPSKRKVLALGQALQKRVTEIRQTPDGSLIVEAGGRMKVKHAFYGLAPPRLRQPTVFARPSVTVYTRGAPGTGQFVEQPPERIWTIPPGEEIMAFSKSFEAEFDRVMLLGVRKKLLTSRALQSTPGPYAREVTQFLQFASDGVTPTTENVSIHTFRMIDPFRLVWKLGYSPLMRIAKGTGGEINILPLDPFLTRIISKFISRPQRINDWLFILLQFRWIGGDNKSLGLVMGSGLLDCASCDLPRSAFPAPLAPNNVAQFQPLSLHAKAAKYVCPLLCICARPDALTP